MTIFLSRNIFTLFLEFVLRIFFRQLKSLWSAYRRSRELITIGAYTEGSDARIDRAIELMPMIEAFLCQEVHDPSSLQASVTAMRDLLASSPNRTTEPESA